MSQVKSSISRVRRRVAPMLGIALLALAGGGLVAVRTEFDVGPAGATAGRTSAPSATIAGTVPATTIGQTPRPVAPSTPPSAPDAAPVAMTAATSSPERTLTPVASPALVPAPAGSPFAIDLYQKGDFVSESRKIFCVPAAMQVMVNIMSPGADHTGRTQRGYYALARKLSPPTLRGDGAEPEGWAAGLNQLGFGPYAVGVQPTRTAAIHVAARALRMTGRPVGLLVWTGAHSWVMSGFKATADPALTDDFTVTHVYVEDVWYPRISSIWGESRPPDALVPVKLLSEDFLRWKRPERPYPGKDGTYVMVLPLPGA
jgi:hypothetical protein